MSEVHGSGHTTTSDPDGATWRCDTRTRAYTSVSGFEPPACVMCGEPVTAGQAHSSWVAPGTPGANQWGRVVRHGQAVSGGPTSYRFDRKWGRAR